ncbi:MAG: tetratricopeptide repeat protein, partial [Nannocystaceae bacterium]
MNAHAHHEQQPGPAPAYVAQANQWAGAGRPDQAVPLYVAALGLQPHDLRVRMMLADCLVRCGQTAAAAQEYLQVATGYASHRRDAEAMAICHRVLALDPSQFVYVAVADMLRRFGRSARALCARAAEAHLSAGRQADGLNMLRLGAELDARNPQVRRRLAVLCRSAHMLTDAVAHLAEAGRLLLAAGNNGEYVDVAEELLAMDPRHLETLRELPRVYLRIGEPQRAVVKLGDLMRVSPGDTVGYETLAHAFAVIGRTSTSLSVLGRLVTELRSTGRAPQAAAMLQRAENWRLDDASFAAAVAELGAPEASPPPPPPPRRPRARPTTAEGTVVLDIRDLFEAELGSGDEIALDSADIVELDDGENTLVLRLPELSRVGPAPRRLPPPRWLP